jgi:hypothetical protein
MVLPAVLLWGVGTLSTEFARLHIPIRWGVFGWSIRLGQISNLLLVLVVVVLLQRRLLNSIRSQRQMALDVKQADDSARIANHDFRDDDRERVPAGP